MSSPPVQSLSSSSSSSSQEVQSFHFSSTSDSASDSALASSSSSSEEEISEIAQGCLQDCWSSARGFLTQAIACLPPNVKKVAKVAIPVLCAIGALVCFMFSPLVQTTVACVFLVLGGIVLAGIAADILRRSDYIAKMSQDAVDEAERKKRKAGP